MVSSFRIPGTLGPEITVRRTMLGGIAVLADGQSVPRRRGRGLRYDIPMADGSTREVALTGQYLGLRATVDGTEIPLEEKLRPWQIVLVFLPLALIVLGGLIGGLIGAVGFAVNSLIARSAARGPVKALGMVAVAAIAGLVWFGIAFSLAPTLHFTTGDCVNGIHEGAVITTSSSRSVACAAPHDNEIIGTFDHPSSDAFPGQAALESYAASVCIPAFQAYVGVDFAQSSLDMIPVLPTNETWGKGDRQVACVVVTRDGSQLTNSVKDSGL